MRSTAPSPPPIPADPATCRWCGRTRVMLAFDVLLCPSGCADTHQAPYRGLCEDCGAEFMTGGRNTTQCWACADQERRAVHAEYAGPTQRPHGYTHDSQVRGTNRRALELKHQAERKGGA